MSDWKKAAKQRVKEAKEGESFKLVEGDNCFRVLPNKKGVKFAPYVEFKVHRNVGPDNRFVRCGKHMDGSGKCWLCDVKIPELAKSKSKSEIATKIRQANQFMVQVSRYNPETEKFSKAKPWWVSTGGARSLSTALLSLLSSTKRSYDDPKKGYNISCERTGSGMKDTRYGAFIPDDEPTALPSAMMESAKEFGQLVPKYSVEEQKAAYYGRKKEDEVPEEEESGEDETETNEDETEGESEEETSDEEEESSEGESEGEEDESSADESEGESEEEGEAEEAEEEEPAPKPKNRKKGKTAPPAKKGQTKGQTKPKHKPEEEEEEEQGEAEPLDDDVPF